MKIKILIAFLLVILTMGAVSAADDNLTASEDLQVVASPDQQEFLSANDEGTFSQLSSLIKDNPTNATLKLDKDFTNTDFKEGIVISKPITIDGAGHTIDANKKTRIFKIKASGVVLKNIVFKNGFSNNGGALFFDEDCRNNHVENCEFIGCYANPNGDSKFDEYGSHAYTQSGGAIYFEYQCENNFISDCDFINCGATSNGNEIYSQDTGAIYFNSQCQYNHINNSNFINCSSPGDSGAVKFKEYCYDNQLNNCNFINCTCEKTAGAVYMGGEYNSVTNCSFINCSAKNSGAVSFSQGFVLGDGGTTIFDGSSHCIIRDSTFINCQAKDNGGAISYYDNAGNVMDYWELEKAIQKVNLSNGGIIDNCSFINCQAKKGGAIYAYDANEKQDDVYHFSHFGSDNILISNCDFEKCIATYGGAVHFGDDSNYGTLSECLFVNCSADFGGSAYWNSTKGKIEKSRFISSKAKNGGAVYAFKNVALTISDCEFKNNSASELGSAVYGGLISNCNFTENSDPEIYNPKITPEINVGYSILNHMPISVETPRDATGNLSVYISYGPVENYTFVGCADIVNDSAKITYNCMKIGDYRIKTILNTNYGIFESFKNKTVSYIEFDYEYIYYMNRNYRAHITLPEDATGNFSVYLKTKDGQRLLKCANLTEGSAEIYFSSSVEGNQEVIAVYDGNYGFENKSETIEFCDGSEIFAEDASIYYNDTGKYIIEVFGVDGYSVAKNTVVTIKIDTKTLKGKANPDGIVSVNIPKLKPGKYTITSNYFKAKITKKLTVKHIVSLKTVKVKKSAKKLTLQATLKNKKAIKGKTVTFKFNGKTYKAKTDKKGIAKVTIKSSVLKKLKVGKKITYQATYLKDTVKKTAKVQK